MTIIGSVRCNGEYYPVIALLDIDDDVTEDLFMAETLVFEFEGAYGRVENASGILVPLQ